LLHIIVSISTNHRFVHKKLNFVDKHRLKSNFLHKKLDSVDKHRLSE
jgi:hypothetical protein